MDSSLLAVDGLQLFYVTAGEGVPIVYIHGNTASSRWFSRVMDMPGFKTFALDMPNFGRSSALPVAPDIHVYADYVKKFIDALHIGKPVLVGHSLGGAVAQSLAVRYPDAIRALVLVDSSSPQGLLTPKDRYPFIEMMRKDRNLLSKALAATAPILQDQAFFESLVDDAAAMAEKAWTGNADALSYFDVTDKCKEFSKPVLVLWGRKDYIITETMARETASAFPKGRLEILEDIGHSVIVENPGQFRELVLGFLNSIGQK